MNYSISVAVPNWVLIYWSIKNPKLGLLALKLRMKTNSQAENSTNILKNRTKQAFSPKLVLKGVSPPVLDLLHLFIHSCSFASLTNRMESCKPSELIPSFMKQYSNLLTFQLHSNWGMKQGSESRTMAQRQDELTDNSNA
jgi:hypothetical protein